MATPKFPLFYYNDKGEFLVCDNADQVEKAKAKGFKPTPPSKPIEFPVTLYDKNGNTRRVGSPAEKKEWLGRGFSEDFVAPKAEPAQALASDRRSSRYSIRRRKDSHLSRRAHRVPH